MAEYPSLPIFTDAYLGDTTHLTLEEHGAYLKLLMIAWRSPDCDLPNDPKRLSVMLGVGLKKFASIWATVGLFWDEVDGRLTQKKLLKVRSRVNHMVEQKRAAGIASAEAKRLKSSDSGPTDVPTETPTERQRGGQQPKPNLTGNKEKPPSPVGDSPPPTDQQIARPDPPPPKRDAARGSRLPDDWRPNDDARRTAHDEGLNDEEIDRCAAKFRDYWCAKPGAGGRKCDWLATWRNWVRREVDDGRVGRRLGGGTVGGGAASGRGGSPDSSAAAAFARAAQRQSSRRATGGGAG